MSVLTIRAHRRYALRSPAKLKAKGGKANACLLIELSQEGARLSNLGDCPLTEGEEVTLAAQGKCAVPAIIRWAHDGVAGLRLTRPLRLTELSDWVEADRRREDPAAKVA